MKTLSAQDRPHKEHNYLEDRVMKQVGGRTTEEREKGGAWNGKSTFPVESNPTPIHMQEC